MLQRDEGVQTKFSVEIDFTVIGIFMGVSGLSASMETKVFAEGGVNGYQHILPGPIKYGNIKLTMGIVNGYELWHWQRPALARQRMSGMLDSLEQVTCRSNPR